MGKMTDFKSTKNGENKFSLKNHMRKHAIIYVFLLPVLIHFVIFFLAPIVFSFMITFFDWPIVGQPKFIGLGNWKRFVGDAIAWKSLKNTLVFSIYYIVPSMAIGLALAMLIFNQKKRVETFFKGIFFLPVVTSFVVVAGIWKWLFLGTEGGFVNQFLSLFNVDTQMFLSSSNQALIVLAGLSIFKIIGSTMIYYFAGLQGIPDEYYEAAYIDGASSWKTFWSITFPLLTPIHFYVAVMTTIGSFQVFDSAFLLTRGGPNFATNTIVYYMYQEGFSSLRLGYASVLAYVLFFMVFIVSMIQKKFLGKNQGYS